MPGIFISGTDTGVGKTIITGLLARCLKEQGYRVVTQKWIQTGNTRDINRHLSLSKIKKSDLKDYWQDLVPYRFKLPASPHLAAQQARRQISSQKIKRAARRLTREFDFVLAEGIGGALVPFNKKKLVIDIAKELALPVLIVAQNKLGAINHTLLTVEAIKKRGMRVLGIIFNGSRQRGNRLILGDNPKIIKAFSGARILGSLPWRRNDELLYKAFGPLAKKILRRLKDG